MATCMYSKILVVIGTHILCLWDIQPYLPTKNFFFAGQNPTFCRTFLVFGGHPWSFQNIPQILSNTLNSSILYQNARHKFCRTLSRICRTAGYLRQKSRTVGNYLQLTSDSYIKLRKGKYHTYKYIPLFFRLLRSC